jgi:hypothetical protein
LLSETASVTVNSVVYSALVANEASLSASFTLNAPITPAPQLRVTSLTGQALANKRVVAVAIGAPQFLGANVLVRSQNFLRAQSQDRIATLANNIAYTDENGVARFSSLQVTGYVSSLLLFFCCFFLLSSFFPHFVF